MSDEKTNAILNGTEGVTLTWREPFKRERDEQEAAFQFVPAEHVAYLKHKTRADLRVEAKVRYAAIGKFPWSVMMMQRLGDCEAMHTLRSGCESTYQAACLAALTAAKELADGE